MCRVDSAVRVNVETGLFTAGRLGFQNPSKRCSRVLREKRSRGNAAIIRNHCVSMILMEDMNGYLIKEVSVLPIHKRLGALIGHRLGREDEDILKFLDWHVNPRPLARAKTPQ